ncbi:UxaA family hydrolase [Lawsonibacter hominis]|uniref:UxaA family hydrolase n=1 Tax=Lawsonibacter hominis TaxID=2763053 RepID=A0A8J6JCL7_9FIRM|nr:UxaA family hydrolase [Lawsonibacter hominis]MBC5732759.1 UxaA family hydrolase [Lawsonibacter hominis]
MHFMGYRRTDGHVGIRNHVVVMPGCICSAGAARKICEKSGATYLYNPNGCAQDARDTAMTLEILSGLIANGNVYGALIVGLGCESIQEARYMEAIRKKTDKPVRYISIQKEGGLGRTVAHGLELVAQLQQEARACRRESCDISELIVGLECGGSDPTSGFSINVVLGNTSDRLVDLGGTTILCETPEAIGAENILKRRGCTPQVGQQLYDAVLANERRHLEAGEDIRNVNPSPGNKAGGLTTLEEKSIGCVHKSGTRPFQAVYSYGQMVDKKGLVFMDGTAYDVASTMSLIAGGAQLVVFTTGLGTPVGSAIAPVLKATGNGHTAQWLEDIIDFDSSASITGEKTVEALGDELLKYICRVCDGELVKAEINGISDMAIDQMGSYC